MRVRSLNSTCTYVEIVCIDTRVAMYTAESKWPTLYYRRAIHLPRARSTTRAGDVRTVTPPPRNTSARRASGVAGLLQPINYANTSAGVPYTSREGVAAVAHVCVSCASQPCVFALSAGLKTDRRHLPEFQRLRVGILA